jgi:hypothetical protein
MDESQAPVVQETRSVTAGHELQRNQSFRIVPEPVAEKPVDSRLIKVTSNQNVSVFSDAAQECSPHYLGKQKIFLAASTASRDSELLNMLGYYTRFIDEIKEIAPDRSRSAERPARTRILKSVL